MPSQSAAKSALEANGRPKLKSAALGRSLASEPPFSESSVAMLYNIIRGIS